jgi:hypothetical protein
LDALFLKVRDQNNSLQLIVTDIIDKLKDEKDDTEEYEKYTRILEEIIGFNTKEVVNYFVPILFTNPMPSYAIDVVTSTAEIFGPLIFEYEETEDIFV